MAELEYVEFPYPALEEAFNQQQMRGEDCSRLIELMLAVLRGRDIGADRHASEELSF